MNVVTIILAVVLVVVITHDFYQSRLLDKLADKYHVSNLALKKVTKELLRDNY